MIVGVQNIEGCHRVNMGHNAASPIRVIVPGGQTGV